jgi:Tfp pilus tip-associated adhesin PilY1
MRNKAAILVLVLAALMLVAGEAEAVNIGDYTSTPPFVTQPYAPNVMLVFSNGHTMTYVGHRDLTHYNNAQTYYGYFDPNKCYKYDGTAGHQYFYTQDTWNAFNHYTVNAGGQEADGSTTLTDKDLWSGNFLNWLTMASGDFVRKGLTGGYVPDGDTDNSTYWVLERMDILDADHFWMKVYGPPGVDSDIGGLMPGLTPPTTLIENPTPANRTLYFDFEDANWTGITINDTASAVGGAPVNNSGTAMNGTLPSSTTVLWGSKSARFNSSGKNYVQVADDDEISNFDGGKLTIEFWMYRNTSDNGQLIIGNGGTSSDGGFQVVGMAKSVIRFELRRSGQTGFVETINSPSDGQWHHVVCTYDNNVDQDNNPATPGVGVMRIYIDGCLQGESSTEFSGVVGNSASPLSLGFGLQAPYNKKYFDGYLDEVSIWKESFTPAMVRTRYENAWGARTSSCSVAAGSGTTYYFKNQHTSMTVAADPTTPSLSDKTYYIRVKTTTEPRGLLQDFSTSVRFGLMSYAYGATDEGGVLRANCSMPGEPNNEFDNIITFVNTFIQKGWDPLGELYWEATRYFRNNSHLDSTGTYVGDTFYKANHTFCPNCGPLGDGKDANLGFDVVRWVDPMRNECQKDFIIVINDEYPSKDQNQMPANYNSDSGVPSESPPAPRTLQAATVGPDTAPAGGLSTEWWTNEVGKWEGINGTNRMVGNYAGTQWNSSDPCTVSAPVGLLGEAAGICPSEPTTGNTGDNGTFDLAGAAYWAHTTHLRPDLLDNASVTPEKRISIETFAVAFRASPNTYVVPPPPMNALWLAAKYGGFQDKNGNNIPDDPSEWDADGDGVPDNFFYAEDGEQLALSLRKALIAILARSASGTAASILSASRSGQGSLYQAMFYPGRVDRLGNRTDWSGQVNAFWVDQFGNLREETPGDPITPPSQIVPPFDPTHPISTSGIELKELNPFHDKVVKLFFDTTVGYTRAKLYPVSALGRIVSGKATKVDTAAPGVLWDAGADFLRAGVQPGMVVEQLRTDATGKVILYSSGTIDTVGSTSVTPPSSAGISWQVGDDYVISQEGPDPTVRELDELNPIWDGARWLAEHRAADRNIFTWVDLDNNGTVGGTNVLSGTPTGEVKRLAGTGTQTVTVGTGAKSTTVTETGYVLESDPLASALRPYLRAGSNLESAQIINWIRGVDQPGASLRIRTFLTPNDDTSGLLRTLKLGDIVHSTPTIAGTPMEKYDLIYRDQSYIDFYQKYGGRRNVIYAGANDGMLHAFNGGFYDPDHGIFYDNTYTLGQELWAFIPYQLLPHLEFLTRPDYVHVYYVDQKPKVFDARIFDPNLPVTDEHPHGWATLVLVGMGMGGKDMSVTDDFSNPPDGIQETRTFHSAYVLLDVTDPLQPRFLGSFDGHSVDNYLGPSPALSLTTSYPAVFRIEDKWYMAVGSGPNGADAYKGHSARQGAVYLVELNGTTGFGQVKRVALPTTGLPVTDTNTTFVGDPSSLDLDLATTTSAGVVNWSGEAVYFGSIYQNPGFNSLQASTDANRQWLGRMYRLVLPVSSSGISSLTSASVKVLAQSEPSPTPYQMGPITAAPNVGRDQNHRYWVYFGTGRFYDVADIGDTSSQQLYGIKEPINSMIGELSWGLVSIVWSTNINHGGEASLYNATNAKVYDGGSVDYDGDTHIDYVNDFAGFVTALDNNANNNGWVIRTGTDPATEGERSLGMPSLIGGITLFTSWVPPSGTECEYEGTGYLYAPFFKTGTAYSKSVIGLGTDDYSGHHLVEQKTTLGVGVATTPTVHVGDRTKAFIQSSTGSIIDVETTTAYPVKSGVRSWRMN